MTTTQTISPKATTALDGTYAPCNGANHRDSGEIVIHDRCGAQVAKREDGRLFTVKATGTYGARKYYCWSDGHVCDEARVAMVADERAKAIGTGEIVKGAPVEVFKGRKVPKGTIGTVTWMQDGAYGVRVGIRTADGTMHFTAITNVRAVVNA